MICPTCQNNEIDESGKCPVCGAEGGAEASPTAVKQEGEKGSGNLSGLIEMDYSGPPDSTPPEAPVLPQWRQDLAKRLREIRQKREGAGAGVSAERTAAASHTQETTDPANPAVGAEIPSRPLATPRTPRRFPKVVKPVPVLEAPANEKHPAAKPVPPAEKAGDLPLFRSVRSDAGASGGQTVLRAVPGASEVGNKDVRSVIDRVMAKRDADVQGPSQAPQPSRAPDQPLAVLLEDHLILVSRTLSGLVDLLVVLICTGGLIVATDVTSGIDIFDGRSLIVYAVLLVTVLFVYSIFFLGTANQTIGMMLTDLKVVDSADRRPRMRQILWRCFGYLASLLTFGVVLLWGFFDRQSRCLHDKLSDTHVARL